MTKHVVCRADFGLQCWKVVLGCWALHELDSFSLACKLMLVMELILVVCCDFISCSFLGVCCACVLQYGGHVAVVFVQPVTSPVDSNLQYWRTGMRVRLFLGGVE